MKAIIAFFLHYLIFNFSILGQNDTIIIEIADTIIIENGDTILEIKTYPVVEDCIGIRVMNRKTIKDSIISPQLINKYNISETIAREMFFTNEFSIINTSWIILRIEFSIGEDGTIKKESYKSDCEFRGKDYSLLFKDSLLQNLRIWKPAVLIDNKNKAVEFKIKVHVEVYKEKLKVIVINSDYQVIEEGEFPRPLVFR